MIERTPQGEHMRVGYAQAVYGREEIEAVVDVLENSPHLLMGGPRVTEFEDRVATEFGKSRGVMVNSGSSANLCSVKALELESGSEVITPALTFSTTVAPLIQTGLVPRYVDVDPATYVTSPERIAEAVSSRTSAIMVPNLIGNVPDLPEIRKVADAHGLLVIEDSCDTLGATIDGRPTGVYADVSTTSFYASHVITAGGFGGLLATDDDDVADRAMLLRGWGRSSSLRDESEHIDDRFNVQVDSVEYDAKFVFAEVGYNFLPSAISAAFGLVQLDKLPEYRARRIRNFAFLRSAFEQFTDYVVLPEERSGVDTAWLAFPLIVRPDAPFTRQELQIGFETAGVQTRVVFTGNIVRQPGFSATGSGEGAFPNADRVMEGGLLLGCHQGLDEEALSYIVQTFREFAHDRR
ncbi:MAG: DegT/DnrJ/EryC1/StrS family aminotransferase [Acidimicrobiia bacterium]